MLWLIASNTADTARSYVRDIAVKSIEHKLEGKNAKNGSTEIMSEPYKCVNTGCYSLPTQHKYF